MIDEPAIFDSAAAGCLSHCFDTLVDNMVSQDPAARSKFALCCELCRTARLIAEQHLERKEAL